MLQANRYSLNARCDCNKIAKDLLFGEFLLHL